MVPGTYAARDHLQCRSKRLTQRAILDDARREHDHSGLTFTRSAPAAASLSMAPGLDWGMGGGMGGLGWGAAATSTAPVDPREERLVFEERPLKALASGPCKKQQSCVSATDIHQQPRLVISAVRMRS